MAHLQKRILNESQLNFLVYMINNNPKVKEDCRFIEACIKNPKKMNALMESTGMINERAMNLMKLVSLTESERKLVEKTMNERLADLKTGFGNLKQKAGDKFGAMKASAGKYLGDKKAAIGASFKGMKDDAMGYLKDKKAELGDKFDTFMINNKEKRGETKKEQGRLLTAMAVVAKAGRGEEVNPQKLDWAKGFIASHAGENSPFLFARSMAKLRRLAGDKLGKYTTKDFYKGLGKDISDYAGKKWDWAWSNTKKGAKDSWDWVSGKARGLWGKIKSKFGPAADAVEKAESFVLSYKSFKKCFSEAINRTSDIISPRNLYNLYVLETAKALYC